MSKKLSAALGQRIDQAKTELDYAGKMGEAQERIARSRKPKNFTIAQENGEWLDQMAAELTLRTRKKVSTSALVNAILDRARLEDEKCERLEFIK
jgi:hypothetical protein